MRFGKSINFDAFGEKEYGDFKFEARRVEDADRSQRLPMRLLVDANGDQHYLTEKIPVGIEMRYLKCKLDLEGPVLAVRGIRQALKWGI
jgi:hypothetical protein